MACPKKPLPKISPWMRSHGRKMRWEQLLYDLKDSERLMSRAMNDISLGEFGPGDLHMLLLLLEKRKSAYSKCTLTALFFITDAYYVNCMFLAPYLGLTYLRDLLFSVPSSTTSVLLQDCIRRGGQTHAGGGGDSQSAPGWSQSEAIQTLPDRIVLDKQLQSLTGAMDKIVNLYRQGDLLPKNIWRNKVLAMSTDDAPNMDVTANDKTAFHTHDHDWNTLLWKPDRWDFQNKTKISAVNYDCIGMHVILWGWGCEKEPLSAVTPHTIPPSSGMHKWWRNVRNELNHMLHVNIALQIALN